MKLDRPVIVLLAVVIYFFPPVLRADSTLPALTMQQKKVNTCNLSESDSNGDTSENGSQALGKNFLTGWLVITEGKGSNTDPKPVGLDLIGAGLLLCVPVLKRRLNSRP